MDNATKSRILDDFYNPSTKTYHIDCCAMRGCFDGSCDKIRELGGADKTGDTLKDFLTSGSVDSVGDELTSLAGQVDAVFAEGGE